MTRQRPAILLIMGLVFSYANGRRFKIQLPSMNVAFIVLIGYSILTYLAAAKTVDYIISGIEEYTGVTIISTHHEEIRKMITEELGRGVTVFRGKRGFGSHGHNLSDMEILFSVVTRLEITALKSEIEKIDRNAFVITHGIKDTKGGMIKKRPLR